MPVDHRSIPRTAFISAPEIEAPFTTEKKVLHLKAKNLVTLNTGPRAGQRFEVTGITYSFPEAIKGIEKNEGPVEFIIRVYVGSVKRAEHRIVEQAREREEPALLTGTIEPYTAIIVYAGEGLNIEYEAVSSPEESGKGPPFTSLQTKQGEFVVNYNLVI